MSDTPSVVEHCPSCGKPILGQRVALPGGNLALFPAWSRPHCAADAHLLGLTEYLWADLEVRRRHVETLRAQ